MVREFIRLLLMFAILLSALAFAGLAIEPGGHREARRVLRLRAEGDQISLEASKVIHGEFRPFRTGRARPGMLAVSLIDAEGRIIAEVFRNDPTHPCGVLHPNHGFEILRGSGPQLFEVRFPMLDATHVRVARIDPEGQRSLLANLRLPAP